jgi:hypothetical protein
MSSLQRDTRGAAFAEYLILVGAVALLGLGAYRGFGTSMEHKAEAQAHMLDSLSAAPAAGAERAESAAAAPDHVSVAASDPISADAESEGSMLWTVGVFFAVLLIAGGVVIATVARPRHAPSDGDSEHPS